jgi:hypothetical protein
MPETLDTRRFIFRGNAMPFGGRILQIGKEKVSDAIPGPPCAALPVVGGSVRAATRGASHGEAFKWGRTLAESRGMLEKDGSYVTTVTSAVSDVYALNNPHVFQADLIRVSLVSVHPEQGEPSITAKEIVFGTPENGIMLAGQRVDVEFDDDLSAFPTFGDFDTAYRKKKEVFEKHQKSLHRPGEGRFGEKLPRGPHGYVTTSIVRRITWRKKVYEGHTLTLKGFGTIYFGEVLMNETNRRLTMVRLEMGSEMKASVACGEADPNGTWGN